jgi:hypothetical protein
MDPRSAQHEGVPSTPAPTLKLTAHELRQLSVVAVVDPRTVVRFLRGKKIASTCGARIVVALRQLGLSMTKTAATRDEAGRVSDVAEGERDG